MRRWIDLVEAKSFHSGPYYNKTANHQIWKNPTLTELRALAAKHDLRGGTDGQNLFVWKATDMIHGFGADAIYNASEWQGTSSTNNYGRIGPDYNHEWSMYFYRPDTFDPESHDRDYEWQFQFKSSAERVGKVSLSIAEDLIVTVHTDELDNLTAMPFGRIFRNATPVILEGAHTPPKNDPSDQAHYDALNQTGFFGAQAAGCIPMCKKTGRIMLVLRSEGVEEPFTWGNVGGAHHADERPVDAAQRELVEETGYHGPVQMIPLFVFQSGSFRYCNFLALVDEEFHPDLGWEADDHKWVDLGQYPQPLHFGVKAVFNDEASMKVLQHYAGLSGGK